MNPSRLAITVAMAVLVAGCASAPTSSGRGNRYFADPASAVGEIAVMLRERNWARLAEYYDLSESPISRATLVSGDFFYTDERPASAHPGGFWHYKHPFAPGFTYRGCRELETPGVIEVVVGVDIDQGGGLVQRGMQAFLMRRTARGYQIMPHKAPAR